MVPRSRESYLLKGVHCFGSIWQPCAISGNPARFVLNNGLEVVRIAVPRFFKEWFDINRVTFDHPRRGRKWFVPDLLPAQSVRAITLSPALTSLTNRLLELNIRPHEAHTCPPIVLPVPGDGEGIIEGAIYPLFNIIILFPSHHLIISSCTVLRIWPDLACRGFAEELGHVSVGGNIQSSCDSGGNRSRDLRL